MTMSGSHATSSVYHLPHLLCSFSSPTCTDMQTCRHADIQTRRHEQTRAKRISQNVMKVRVATAHNAAMMHTQQISVPSLYYAVETPKARFPNHWVILSCPNYSQCSQHSQYKLLVHMSSILNEKINVYQGHG